MDFIRDHVLHSRAGKLGADGTSSVADVERILKQAADAAPRSGLALHFHGGLVTANAGKEIANRLAPKYLEAGAYPVFFVWESGLIETLKNNLSDIKDDSVFRELVKKVAEWALKQIGGAITKSAAGAAVDKQKLRDDFDRYFDGAAPEPPVRLDSPPSPGYKTRATIPDEDDLAANIEAELENDERFMEVIAGLYVASKRGTTATTKGGQPAAADVNVLVDDRALKELFPGTTTDSTKGVFTWIKVAKFVAKVVVVVVKRHLKDRDHGTYTTIVEEVLRAAYLDRVGELIWRSMKKDTADAFADDPACVGSAVLAGLVARASQGKVLPRISLIGHSTGAIYINNWINRAATLLPQTVFDVVLLAPANRFDDFAEILSKHPASMRNFRMFAMTDANESKDELVPIVYPRSLLYFVSGVLEGEADMPIMGMQRFLTLTDPFSEADFPAVAAVRKWLSASAARNVWSIDGRVSGFGSKALKHGDFDNDEPTIASIGWILQHGY